MKKIILIIKENWKDPVWSKVIAAGIIAILGFLLTTLYSLVISLIDSISFKDSINEVLTFLDNEIKISIWLVLVLSILYLILIFNPVISFIVNVTRKISSPKTNIIEEKKPELPRATEHSTSLFYQRMASAFPGIRDVTWFNEPNVALDRLEILLKNPLRFKSDLRECESDPIWWFRGGSALYIEKFKRTGRKKALMNIDQLKIKRIAAYHGDSYYKDFVYVEVEGEKQAGLYNLKDEDIKRHISTFGYSWEEYGLIKNKIGWTTPIRREDYDDGATVIRGKVREAFDAKLRVRYLSKYNLIIAAKGSPYNSIKFEKESKEYLNQILKNEIEPEVFFEILKGYNKNEQ